MARVLFVSKPVVPPWNDSSKNLARALALELRRHRPIVMTSDRDPELPVHVETDPIYASAGAFAPGLRSRLAMLRRLTLGDSADLWHLFFAPNPKSSAAVRAAAMVRRAPCVHTLCSRPRDPRSLRSLLFADRNVVVSKASRHALLDAGVDEDRVRHVPPCVPPLTPPDHAARRGARRRLGLPEEEPLVVYPGDLEHSRGAARVIGAFLSEAVPNEASLVMACRDKTPRAKEAESELRGAAAPLGDRVHWIGETPLIHELLGAADVVALPSSDLYAKMDLPLVLLEAMWLARAIVVVHDSPAAELADEGGAIATDPDVGALGATLAELLGDGVAREGLGAAAREVVQRRYSASAMARAYEAIYDELLP